MASVTKRGKKWSAIYIDRNGKQKWKTGMTDKAKTLKLAQSLEDRETAIAAGQLDIHAEERAAERGKPIADHLAMFASHMEGKGRHANHCQYTIKDVERFAEHAGIVSAAGATIPKVDAWRSFCIAVGYPKSANGKVASPDSRKTANRRIASVKAFLRYLHGIGAVDHFIMDGYEMLHTKGHETFRRRALTQAEATALIEKCPDSHRRELYRFALKTGLRRSEIESLTPSSFNFEKRTIFLNARAAKVKTSHAFLSMHPAIIEPLKKLCTGKEPDSPVFKVPHRTDVVPILHADCRAAGIDPTDVDFHALRHTFCTLLAAQGVRPEVLMRLARHQDVATTMRFYVHVKPADEREALGRLI